MKKNANLQLKHDYNNLMTYFILDTTTYIISIIFVFTTTFLNIPSLEYDKPSDYPIF